MRKCQINQWISDFVIIFLKQLMINRQIYSELYIYIYNTKELNSRVKLLFKQLIDLLIIIIIVTPCFDSLINGRIIMLHDNYLTLSSCLVYWQRVDNDIISLP